MRIPARRIRIAGLLETTFALSAPWSGLTAVLHLTYTGQLSALRRTGDTPCRG